MSLGSSEKCYACEKPIVFKSLESKLLICPNCRSVNFRKEEWKENELIHFPEVPPDRSPYSLGQKITKQDKSQWEIIGRIRYQMENGYWNQWIVNSAEGKINHLFESAGFIAWCEAKSLSSDATFKGIKLYKEITLSGEIKLSVDSLDKNQFIDLEGEIDQVHLRATRFIQASLSNNQGDFMLLFIYSSSNQEMFLGKYGDFKTFKPLLKS